MFKKALFQFLTALLLTGFGFFLNAHVSNQSPGTGNPIVIRPSEGEISGAPRGPVFNPFTALCWDDFIVVNCLVPYGDVMVTLLSSAGDNYTTVFDTSDESIIIPISGNAGNYTLTLVTQGGITFEGEFYL